MTLSQYFIASGLINLPNSSVLMNSAFFSAVGTLDSIDTILYNGSFFSSAAKEVVENSIGGYSLNASLFSCLVSILTIGTLFFVFSIKSMKRQNY